MADDKTVVNLRDKVKIKGIKHSTAEKQKLVVGKEYEVHPDTADCLVDSGHAEYSDKKKK